MTVPDREAATGGHLLHLVGVELGGTKCVCTLGDERGGIALQTVVPTRAPAETFAAINAVLEAWRASHRPAAIGIGAFGPLDLNPASLAYGRVLATSKAGWRQADVLGALTRGRDVPARIDTDVNAAALAEIRWGSGQGLADFAYVTVGTGIGVGLVVGGRTPRGITHCEMGHIRIPSGPRDAGASVCPFHDDCLEGLASGPAILKRLAGAPLSDVVADAPIWDEVAAHLAVLCHAILCTTGARRIVFGGGVMTGQPHLVPKVREATRRSLNGYLDLPDLDGLIAMAALGAEAGPLGTLALAADALHDGAPMGAERERIGGVAAAPRRPVEPVPV